MRGNSVGNLINDGFAAADNGFIYVANEGALYKMRPDGTDKTRLQADAGIASLNLIDNCIYYTSYTAPASIICKTSKEGGESTIVPCKSKWYSEGFQNIAIIDNVIYFQSWLNSHHLYRMDIDGDNLTRLSSNAEHCVNVLSDWIYYINAKTIYKIRAKDGTGKIKLCNNEVSFMNVDGEWIYYICCADRNALYKIKTDGSNKTKLGADPCGNINVQGDYIYYINEGDEQALYRINKDGTGRMQIAAANCSRIIIAPSKLIYETVNKSSSNSFVKATSISVANIDGGNDTLIMDKSLASVTSVSNVEFSLYKTDKTGKNRGNLSEYLNADLSFVDEAVVYNDCLYYKKHKNIYKLCMDNGERQSKLIYSSTGVGGDFCVSNNTITFKYYKLDTWSERELISDGDHLYYAIVKHSSETNQIRRINLDGTGEETLWNGKCNRLYVCDNFVFFLNSDNKNRLCRICTDGTGFITLSKDSVDSFGVIDGFVYYSSDGLYKIKAKGGEKGLLLKESCTVHIACDGWVYYTKNCGGGLWKIRNDGSDRINLTQDKCDSIVLSENILYYSNGNNKNTLYKINTDGTGRKKLSGDSCDSIFLWKDNVYYRRTSGNGIISIVANDTVYFCDANEGYNLFKMNTKGSEKKRLNCDDCGNIRLSGDWIYYTDYSDKGNLYKIRTNGTGKTEVI